MSTFKKILPLILICTFLVSCDTNVDEPNVYNALTPEYLSDVGLSDFVFPDKEYFSKSESTRIYNNCTYDEFVSYLNCVVDFMTDIGYPIYYTNADYDEPSFYLFTVKYLFIAESNDNYFLKKIPDHYAIAGNTTDFDITDNTWFEIFYEYDGEFHFISSRYNDNNISIKVCNTSARTWFTYMLYTS